MTLSVLFILIVLLFGSWVYYILFSSNNKSNPEENVTVIIQPGMTVNQIANTLFENNLIVKRKDFIFGAKLLRKAHQLKAGRYEISKGLSHYQIINQLVEGKISSIRVTVLEGVDSRVIASELSQKLGIDSLKFMNAVWDSSLLKSLGIPGNSLEGFLFPDTYDFFWQQNEEAIVKRMVNHFFEIIPDSVLNDMKGNPKKLVETITLASIIQGEAIVTDEMPTISGVYTNRIKRRMLLQADPTLQYIIDDGPRRLTNRDKEIQSPYNTYLFPGLPPGPINNPGLQAIIAAANPADVPYLYFVANGDGTHTFSRTFSEHLVAKRKFDKIRRDYYRKKRMEKIN